LMCPLFLPMLQESAEALLRPQMLRLDIGLRPL